MTSCACAACGARLLSPSAQQIQIRAAASAAAPPSGATPGASHTRPRASRSGRPASSPLVQRRQRQLVAASPNTGGEASGVTSSGTVWGERGSSHNR
eukprot:CAMPEP_0181240922 /NCGR_PEP_ID=MMETSP1096-20121128/40818_1 /TAXON_ID=156174 ORGANISM="Chrysochromulina ericina, Strain CCMP281" /NCGR_SAMPLE_ID=MMETSP1096 /ASSEMBLY_ACC=CAM_ASM_000453 /LENGTH=96 /DNA_ID=CAMNT_0023336903 /DNA_START=123 /DNA_END=413 /DNA_ORIENTATION=+